MSNNSEALDFDKICRTCLSTDELKSLNINTSPEVCLVDMLMSCTFVELYEDDGLPTKICQNCIQEVNRSYNFALKCQESEEKLRLFLKNDENQQIGLSTNKTKGSAKKRIISLKTKKCLSSKTLNNEIKIINDTFENVNPNCNSSQNVLLNTENYQSELSNIDDTNEIKIEIHEIKLLNNENYQTKLSNINYIEIKNVSKESELSNNEIESVNCDNFIKIEDHQNDEKILSNEESYGSGEQSNEESVKYVVKKRKTKKVKKSIKKKTTKTKLISKSSYECKKCNIKFATYMLLLEHYRKITHKNLKQACHICSKYYTPKFLKQHLRRHANLKYKCELCDKEFTTTSNLWRHKKLHEVRVDQKPYKCDICGAGFTQSYAMKEHRRIHTGEKPYVCDICGKSFRKTTQLKIHANIHFRKVSATNKKNAAEKPQIQKHYQCDSCEKSFDTKPLLKQHQLIHGEKSFLCSECGRQFFSLRSLQMHAPQHSSVKPYSCPLCQKSFRYLGALQRHQLVHTGERPYSCTLCSQSFKQTTHLKFHMRTHTGERPHVCSVCSKTFALNGNLKVHMRMHTGEMPYTCPVCGKGFHDSSSMKKHKKGHDGQHA